MIGEREAHILEMLVREYIRSAEPVSSERIAGRLKNSLSPATVRNVFSDLTDSGFIEQHHISGGRVPRTPAYRFFVDRVMSGEARTGTLSSGLERLLTRFDEASEAMRALQEEVAEHLHVLSYVSGAPPVGFDRIFHEPEFQEKSLVEEFGSFLDTFEKYEETYVRELDSDSYDVIIGEENSIQPITHVSIVVTKTPAGDLFFMAGPTRMHYDRIINMMNIWQKKAKTTKKKKMK